MGNAGDDHIIGWTGTDTAVFSSARDLYEVESLDSNRTILTYIGDRPSDGQDRVDAIEILQFADGELSL